MGKKAVHFGAGNIGRGFVACFLAQSNYEVVFADVVEDLIKNINSHSSYKVIELGDDGTDEKTITGYRALNSNADLDALVQEIATADVVTCSVGPNILRFIAPAIAKGIDARSDSIPPIAVIACENMIGATTKLHEEIAKTSTFHDKRARYANSAIDRIVPDQGPKVGSGLDVKLEKFYEWVVEKTPFEEYGIPSIDGIKWVDDLKPYIERKLYTVNTSHATAAYHGYNRGKRTVDEALRDEFILGQVRKALAETSELIVSKHKSISVDEQKAYVEKIISRISNPHLADAVERVGRAPIRKLGLQERFIGPASQLAVDDKDVTGLLGAVEVAFRFQNVPGDDESKELAKILAENSADDVVTKVCGLEKDHPLFSRVSEIVTKVQGSKA
ncbi:probable Mannitol-1-phosphate 5-dehydrogenase [Cephalotrichum gorgonifer]|uniref:Mannitol-1-phosphate 5-dehydrogenase n=1 Tax=Cephalotrichum gorgonifer TaxID=2041049 RepID=A0AAE8MRB8_9PEZI|nr:probable Mannitol-1-phosphate 5-dehydrogenase [Cephalotrichum gorgonifer]